MSIERQFPVRPDLDQLKKQAKELLQAFHQGDPEAIAVFSEHRGSVTPATAKLADAQFVLARIYSLPSWPRLVIARRTSHDERPLGG
ncbi:hypothetical protein BH11ARM2_BH11ARM2_04640 [soil metagenome]